MSSSKKDEDNASDFDRYESNLIKQDESLFIQSKMNSLETMNTIDTLYGPYDQWMIDFYKERLKNEKGVVINSFQKQMIFNLFYKMFGDVESIYAINTNDYVKLMLAAKTMLKQSNMIILPYIISGKVDKIVGRKSVNKKELLKLQSSTYYDMIMKKYRDEKIVKSILSMIATILSSDFSIIDYTDRNLDGRHIEVVPEIVIEEVLMYTLLI